MTRRGWLVARCPLVGAVALLGLLVRPMDGRGQAASEYEVKGAFVAKFASFIEWPADAFEKPTAPVLVCVAGKSALENGLATSINRARVGERPLLAQPFSPSSRCQMLFIAAAEQKNLIETLPALSERTVTVGEQANFLAAGGTIEFRTDGSRLQFDISLAAIGRATYRISSRLLILARKPDPSASGQ